MNQHISRKLQKTNNKLPTLTKTEMLDFLKVAVRSKPTIKNRAIISAILKKNNNILNQIKNENKTKKS